jgi:hypothetical protein
MLNRGVGVSLLVKCNPVLLWSSTEKKVGVLTLHPEKPKPKTYKHKQAHNSLLVLCFSLSGIRNGTFNPACLNKYFRASGFFTF